MEEILIALFVIGFITLIGHGIWVLLAMILRAIFSEPKAERAAVDDGSDARPRRKTRCAECGADLLDGDIFCPLCGRDRSSARPMADLAITARQLDKYLRQGRLDAETHKLIIGLVEEERTRLSSPARSDTTPTRREAEPPAA